MKCRFFSRIGLILLGLIISTAFDRPILGQSIHRAGWSGQLDPAIDKLSEPFSYFSRPTDVIGVMDAPAATLITPEGNLYSDYGELIFFTGNPRLSINRRVKTLLGGYLPVVQYEFTRAQVFYRFTTFAAMLGGGNNAAMVDFVRVQIRNDNNKTSVAHFSTAFRYQDEKQRFFYRPAPADRIGDYSQLGEEFNPEWHYRFFGDALLRDNRIAYLFPAEPALQLKMTIKEDVTSPVLPTTPVGIVDYALQLAPRQQRTLVFKMPYLPIDARSPYVGQLRAASFDEYLARTTAFWEKILTGGISISVPEQKVNDTFKASLIYDLIAREKIGNDYVQTVNDFQYHAFWLRDCADIARMYDVSGYPAIARQVLDFFATWQQPDGNFVSQGGQFDGWGQTLWAYGQHYRITHDRGFAEQIYPSVQRAVAWLRAERQRDPLHLMPATTPGDNEALTGHVTGHNFWALAGLQNAIGLAESLDKSQDAQVWRSEYDDYHNALVQALNHVTAKTDGYIPPGLDGEHGQDWGNLEAVYPEIVLDPFDPKVTATLRATRAKYQEGLMTYDDGRYLHHYLTIKNTETEVIRGDQQTALDEFYALLIHTSSTHAGFEYQIPPWSTRDFVGDLSPHGLFAAEYRTLLRNMLVREQGNDLHLLSVISPAWMKRGGTIRVLRAPTNFGEVSLALDVPEEDHGLLRLTEHYNKAPTKLIVHIPWFLTITRAVADGRPISAQGGTLVLPPQTQMIDLHWSRSSTANISYVHAVNAFKAEYRRRYAADVHR